ncbi:hydroxyacylglutathione hydrolase [Kingella negevensis]|uniref:hydroxyacylglutathione hydrolase n=1 Tax=Kingella negevensis TaxID=1522312 RepID=UPI0009DCE1F3|nr:hydroxyacylglutathione hydrolase [Kingella negevensis]MDK4689286.1 hydroxyacylglutathione hydrolase [Kingella negevensis]WII92192.1 hydroxyacylglutathione hydrolase [Kingella negevensis]
MSSLKIIALPAFNDNYIWLLQRGNQAVCVDTGQAEPVLNYLREHNLTLAQIWVTHPHGDHTLGIAELQQHFPDCQVFGAADIQAANQRVGEGDVIEWQGLTAQVWHTAGHTAHHLSYVLQDGEQAHIFCGDTLFSAGCGRVFPDGRVDWLHHSLQRINTQPENTLLYPAHEYTAANLRFAAHIEADNADVQAALRETVAPSLPVSLAHEQRVNPFLRVHLPEVRVRVQQLAGQALVDDEAVFATLRELKNQF